jgi:hypothetical protein
MKKRFTKIKDLTLVEVVDIVKERNTTESLQNGL